VPEKLPVEKLLPVAREVAIRWGSLVPTSERIVQDVLRFPVALDAIIEAQGAKVKGKGARKGRRGAKRYVPPSCPEAERLTRVEFERLDPNVM